jgi:hypothetical protein
VLKHLEGKKKCASTSSNSRKVHPHLVDEKTAQQFYEIGEVHQNLDEEKKCETLLRIRKGEIP